MPWTTSSPPTTRILHDLVAGFDLALLQNTEIETVSPMRDQQRRYLRLAHADAHPVTGDARLCHFERSAADPVTIANAHLLVGQAFNGEVFFELSIGEIVSTELALPIVIGVDLKTKMARCSPPCPAKSPCPSPSILSCRTKRRP